MKKRWENDSKAVAKYYIEKIAEKSYSVETIAGRDKKYTNTFYNELLLGISIPNNASFLDIGSGVGLFIPYLNEKRIKLGEYLGVDLIPLFVDYSKKTYPDYQFILGDFMSKSFKTNKKYDYVFALGVLVSRVSDYEEYLLEFIKKMTLVSRKYVLFNLITEIDEGSSNYDNRDKIGGITSINKKTLEKILMSIDGIEYKILEKRIFEDATDAFVQIKIKE